MNGDFNLRGARQQLAGRFTMNAELEGRRRTTYARDEDRNIEYVAVTDDAQEFRRVRYGRQSYAVFFDQAVIRQADIVAEEILLRDVHIMKDAREIDDAGSVH